MVAGSVSDGDVLGGTMIRGLLEFRKIATIY